MFCENIKNMTDEQILTALKNKSDYNPLFVELAMKEIRIRGYNMNESDLQIDYKIIEFNDSTKITLSENDEYKDILIKDLIIENFYYI